MKPDTVSPTVLEKTKCCSVQGSVALLGAVRRARSPLRGRGDQGLVSGGPFALVEETTAYVFAGSDETEEGSAQHYDQHKRKQQPSIY